MCSIYWNIAQRGPSELSSEPSQRKCQGRSKGSWSLSIRYFFFMPTNILQTSILAHERADLLRGYAKISQTMTGKDFSRTSSSAQKPFPTCEPFRLNWKQPWSHIPEKKPLVRNPKWPGHESKRRRRFFSSFWPFSISLVCFAMGARFYPLLYLRWPTRPTDWQSLHTQST